MTTARDVGRPFVAVCSSLTTNPLEVFGQVIEGLSRFEFLVFALHGVDHGLEILRILLGNPVDK